jgi:hypothetical protein
VTEERERERERERENKKVRESDIATQPRTAVLDDRPDDEIAFFAAVCGALPRQRGERERERPYV